MPEPRPAEEWATETVAKVDRRFAYDEALRLGVNREETLAAIIAGDLRAYAAQECATQEGWLIEKLKQLRAYEVPTDGRSTWMEIQGWMHRLIFVHDQFSELIHAHAMLQQRVEALEALLRRVQDAEDPEEYLDDVEAALRGGGTG